MFGRRSDLPLAHDQSSRFVPWLILLMVYLSTLALAGIVVLEDAIGRWDRDLSGTLTLHIAPAERGTSDAQTMRRRAEEAVRLLQATPGVAGADILELEQVTELLEPWLGPGDLARELPLPVLVDVTLHPGAEIDLEAVAARLAQRVPGAVLDAPRTWLRDLMALARSVEAIAIGVVLLIGLVAMATVVFVTRTGLEVHQEVVEVLHLIGARDSYVARQFQHHAFVLSLKGGIIGLFLAVLTLVILGHLGGRLEATLLPQISLTVAGWASLVIVPIWATAIAMVTARLTVLRTLARLL